MKLQELIEQKRALKQALNQSLKEIDTQIVELLPKREITVMEWLQWAKENGFDWAQSAIDQCGDVNGKRFVFSLKGAVIGFNNFHDTKEGFGYWNKICNNV